MTETKQTGRTRRSTDANSPGGRAGINRQLPAQVRRQLQKHYLNKYRAGKRSAH